MPRIRNIEDHRAYTRLKASVDMSRRRLEPFRERRHRAIREYVGHNYSDTGTSDIVPANFLELAVNVYIRNLAATAPRVMISSSDRALKPTAAAFESAINEMLIEINAESTLKQWVMEALFALGVVKVGITPIDQMAGEMGFLHDAGQPFMDVVTLDDWVHDISAMEYERATYSGDLYKLPFDYIKESGLFDKTEKIVPDVDTRLNEQGDWRAETVSRGFGAYDHELFGEWVRVWDIWLPEANQVVTIPYESDGQPIRVVDWDGPEHGPYHMLNYTEVPGNLMPLSPVMTWMDLHDLSNRLFRKLGRQAERQKTITVFAAGAEQDAKVIMEGDDGDLVRSDQPDKTREVRYGGIDNENLAMFLQTKDLFFTLAGNLDALGGLSPQSRTLGQDELLNANASQRVIDMQDKTVASVGNVMRSLAWYEWTDPVRTRKLSRRIPNTTRDVSISWDPDTREGDFVDYNFKIDPYSMQHQSPGMKLQGIASIMNQFVAPYMEMMQQQGLVVDFDELFNLVAKYSNQPELKGVLKLSPTPVERAGASGESTPKSSPVTTRNQVRTNIPGASRGGKDDVMSRILMGGGVQGSEAASVSRPTSPR